MWNNCLVKVHFKFANHSISKYLSNNTSTYLEHSLVNKHYLKACYTLRRLGSFLSVRSSYQCLVCLFFARHQSTKLQCATVGQSVFISNNVECCCYRLIPLSDRGLHGSRVKVKETWLMNWNWCDGYPVWSWKRSLARWDRDEKTLFVCKEEQCPHLFVFSLIILFDYLLTGRVHVARVGRQGWKGSTCPERRGCFGHSPGPGWKD